MIGLSADVSSIHSPDLLGVLQPGPGLSGPGLPGPGLSGSVGLSSSNAGGDSVGLGSSGVGLEFNPGPGSVGLHCGIGLFA